MDKVQQQPNAATTTICCDKNHKLQFRLQHWCATCILCFVLQKQCRKCTIFFPPPNAAKKEGWDGLPAETQWSVQVCCDSRPQQDTSWACCPATTATGRAEWSQGGVHCPNVGHVLRRNEHQWQSSGWWSHSQNLHCRWGRPCKLLKVRRMYCINLKADCKFS